MLSQAEPTDTPTAAAVHALSCKGLRKTYGDRAAVDGVGFHVAAGEAYGLLGPNGAGKTTTIGMLLGLVRPDAGQVSIFGRDLAGESRDARRLVGYVPQEIALYPELTARQNLRFFCRLYGLRRAEHKARIAAVLGIVGLSERADERIAIYSGGMRRRINIAAALLHEPALLVLDEPTVGVDAQSRTAILDSLRSLAAEGMAVVYTSHYMNEVEQLCDRVGIIDGGRIVAEGTRRELVARLGSAERVRLTVDGSLPATAARLRDVPGVREVAVSGNVITLVVDDGAAILADLLAAVGGATVTSVETDRPDLEAVFLHLTGTTLRD
jgi:ABC-2 type transport system ATP-binding protein